MSSSLIPEKPLLVSPSLAATIGLEEATMLAVLSDLSHFCPRQQRNNFDWFELSAELLHQQLPFWSDYDIERISQSLRAKGIVLLESAPFSQSHCLQLAFNQTSQASSHGQPAPQAQSTPAPHNPEAASVGLQTPHHSHISRGATRIAPSWQPDREIIQQLGQNTIPEAFIREQVVDFVSYWRERGESHFAWGNKFRKQVIANWRRHQTEQARQQTSTTLPNDWQPSQATLDQLSSQGVPVAFAQRSRSRFSMYQQQHNKTNSAWDMAFYSWVKEDWDKQETPFITQDAKQPMSEQWQPQQHTSRYLRDHLGVADDFIRGCVPEFVHKWLENGGSHSGWGTIFSKHVLEQWRFIQAGIERNPTASVIDNRWRPSADCLDFLEGKCDITRQFAEQQIPEFQLYWINRREARHSWDNVFIRHVKHNWAYAQQSAQQVTDHAGQQAANQSRSTRDIPLAEQLTDTSWAD